MPWPVWPAGPLAHGPKAYWPIDISDQKNIIKKFIYLFMLLNAVRNIKSVAAIMYKKWLWKCSDFINLNILL